MNSVFNNLKTRQQLDRVPTFGYNGRQRKFHVDLEAGESLHFKPKLAAMLGITTNPVHCGNESRKYHGEDLFNLVETIHTLYVYCNIIENMSVGNDETPLQHILGVDAKQGEIDARQPDVRASSNKNV